MDGQPGVVSTEAMARDTVFGSPPTYAVIVRDCVDTMQKCFDEPDVIGACTFLLWNLGEALDYEPSSAPRAILTVRFASARHSTVVCLRFGPIGQNCIVSVAQACAKGLAQPQTCRAGDVSAAPCLLLAAGELAAATRLRQARPLSACIRFSAVG